MREQLDIGLLTSASYPNLQSDYWLIRDELRRRGYRVEPVVWNAEDEDWSKIKNVVICSAWDYSKNYDAFSAWLNGREQDCHVINPPKLAKWNMDKIYLRHFEEHGVPVIPTIWLERGCDSLDGNKISWTDIVMKPRIGAGSAGMKRFDAKKEAQAMFAHLQYLSAKSGVMLQPCLRSADRGMETALIYFNGQFSHSIGKPLAGHQVTSDEEVARTFLREPTDKQREIGAKVIESLPSLPAYIRVDFLPDDEGHDLVLEIEMIEPSLFFRTDDASASRYADALEARWIRG